MRNYFKAFTTVELGCHGGEKAPRRRIVDEAFFPFEDKSEPDTSRALEELIAWVDTHPGAQTSIYRPLIQAGARVTYGFPVIGEFIESGTPTAVEG